MLKYLSLCIILLLACKSKNRFDPSQSSNENMNTSVNSSNTSGNIKGNIEDVESDAIPYLSAVADTPRWNAKLGNIQDEIFDIRLDLSFEKKLCFGILKRIKESGKEGEFFVGEVNTNNQKIQVQFFAEKKPCTDNQQKAHNGRITMLYNNKEYYSCADFIEK
ncbi:MAG: hypothetical protein HOP11_11330 [Saprospiraceae bacterium]|nr:hypothetical protein [Saprospiraceae bacterium]